jgi:hypothetical protein
VASKFFAPFHINTRVFTLGVRNDDQFGIFQDDDHGPLWRASFADLDEAKHHAQEFADDDGREFFVVSFKDYWEVARLLSSRARCKTEA